MTKEDLKVIYRDLLNIHKQFADDTERMRYPVFMQSILKMQETDEPLTYSMADALYQWYTVGGMTWLREFDFVKFYADLWRYHIAMATADKTDMNEFWMTALEKGRELAGKYNNRACELFILAIQESIDRDEYTIE